MPINLMVRRLLEERVMIVAVALALMGPGNRRWAYSNGGTCSTNSD